MPTGSRRRHQQTSMTACGRTLPVGPEGHRDARLSSAMAASIAQACQAVGAECDGSGPRNACAPGPPGDCRPRRRCASLRVNLAVASTGHLDALGAASVAAWGLRQLRTSTVQFVSSSKLTLVTACVSPGNSDSVDTASSRRRAPGGAPAGASNQKGQTSLPLLPAMRSALCVAPRPPCRGFDRGFDKGYDRMMQQTGDWPAGSAGAHQGASQMWTRPCFRERCHCKTAPLKPIEVVFEPCQPTAHLKMC